MLVPTHALARPHPHTDLSYTPVNATCEANGNEGEYQCEYMINDAEEYSMDVILTETASVVAGLCGSINGLPTSISITQAATVPSSPRHAASNMRTRTYTRKRL